MKLTYRHTRIACYSGYITQATVSSLFPLLYVTFQSNFGISLDQIALLIALTFGIQFVVDALATKFADHIGYRACVVFSQVCAFTGILGVGLFPLILPDAYAALVLAVSISAVGCGLIEVIISPIVEALPGDSKAASMSLLHSFFCWGCVAVILLSTLFFNTAGLDKWYILPMLWAMVPLFNVFFFSRVPLVKLVEDHERVPLRKLFSRKLFLLLVIFMLCAGAAELAMSQWASLFAETGLRVSKTVGDLLGPCAFALLMGISRILFTGRRISNNLEVSLLVCAVLCICSYLLVIFSPSPILSLVGCALTGFFVAPMWPGTLSISSRRFPAGGTAMFAIMALGGDAGGVAGPGIVGFISNAVEQGGAAAQNMLNSVDLTELGLKSGLLAATIFPIVLALGLLFLRLRDKKKPRPQLKRNR